MKGSFLLFASLLMANLLVAQNPGGVAGANFWYKANTGVTAGGTFIWANQGNLGAGANATTRAGANNPTYNNTSGSAQINFNPSISFNSSGTQALATPTIAGNILGSSTSLDIATQFVVFRQVGSSQNIYHYSDGTTQWGIGATTAGLLVQQNKAVNAGASISAGQVVLTDMAASTKNGTGSSFSHLTNGGVK